MDIIKNLFPSQNTDADSLKKCLIASGRVYYVYSLLVFIFIKYKLTLLMSVNPQWIILMFMIEAAILLYIFQTYRRFLSISQNIRHSVVLKSFFASWILGFLFYNIFQIILTPLSATGMATPYSRLLFFIPILLSVLGEFLFKKI